MDRNKVFVVGSAVVLAGVMGASFWYSSQKGAADPYAGCRTAAIAGGMASIGGPFTLVDETGTTVTEKDVITKPSLVYFGYTFCPDVCPTDNARNAESIDILKKLGYDVQPVFISIDAERDTPETMAEFTEYMHEDMIGLTGTPEQVKAASQAYKTYYRKQDSGDEYYLVDHSTFTYLVFPEVGFVEFFRRDLSAEGLAEQTSCFIDANA